MHVIGIDVGSQSVKALVTDESGAVLATASAPLVMAHPHDGWAEQDPAAWEDAVAASVRAACAEAGVAGADVRMLGLACQVDGLVALDERLRPLRPAIIWLDRRAGAQTEALTAAAGAGALVERTGLQPDSSPHRAEGDVAARHGARPLPRSALAGAGGRAPERVADRRGRAGPRATRPPRSSTTSTAARSAPSLVAHAGLDPDKLPPIRASHDVVGPLRPEAAEALGLTTACEVVVGTGDEHAAALGAGALGPGIVVDVTGTAEPVARALRHGGHRRRGPGRDPRACRRRRPARREPRLRVRRQHALAGRDAADLAGGRLRARRRGARRRRRRPVRARAVGLDGAALERPDARRLRGPGDEPRRPAPRPRGARGLHVRAARHRRPLRRARASAARRSASSAAGRARRSGCGSRPT